MTSQEPAPLEPTPPEPTPSERPTISPPRFDGRSFEERANAFGRETEAAAQRLASDPNVVGAADVAGRTIGIIVLAIGLWFLADVTLGFDLPSIAWGELWPAALILLGALVVLRGMSRRRA